MNWSALNGSDVFFLNYGGKYGEFYIAQVGFLLAKNGVEVI